MPRAPDCSMSSRARGVSRSPNLSTRICWRSFRRFVPLLGRPVCCARPCAKNFGWVTVLVSAGGGDNMLGAIGTGNIAAGRLSMSLGTSGTLYGFTETPIIDPKGEISAFCDSTDHWLALACTMNVAGAVDRVRDLFRWEVSALEKNVARSQPGAT